MRHRHSEGATAHFHSTAFGRRPQHMQHMLHIASEILRKNPDHNSSRPRDLVLSELPTCMEACSLSCWPLDWLRYDGWPSGCTAPTWLKMSSVLSSSQCSTKRPSLTSQISI